MLIPNCSEGAVKVASGGFSDVSQGTYKGRRVAIKVVRIYVRDLDAIRSVSISLHYYTSLDELVAGILPGGGRLEASPASQHLTTAWSDIKRTPICSRLRVDGERNHQRVHREGPGYKSHQARTLPLGLAAASLMNHSVGWRCEWLEVYARSPHGSRRSEGGTQFCRIKCLRISHSSPKANILINNDRRACLADFGFSTITGVPTYAEATRASLNASTSLMSFTAGGTYWWMSPELLHPEGFGIPKSENRPTRQSDCYALGMVIYEVGVRASIFIAVDS